MMTTMMMIMMNDNDHNGDDDDVNADDHDIMKNDHDDDLMNKTAPAVAACMHETFVLHKGCVKAGKESRQSKAKQGKAGNAHTQLTETAATRRQDQQGWNTMMI